VTEVASRSKTFWVGP